MNEEKVNVAWKPLPGSQTLALSCPCDDILYHGTRGPGKTAAQIAHFLKNVGVGYGGFWKGVIFDRGYKNLGDIISKSKEIIPKIFPKAVFLESNDKLKWVFPDGEELLFRHIKRISDYRDYHGHEYPWMGWNELTSYPTSELYDMMKSCNRSGFVSEIHTKALTQEDKALLKDLKLLGEPLTPRLKKVLLPDIPLCTFATTNPFGVGHSWVKKRFIDCSPPGVPLKRKTLVHNPRTKQLEVVTTTQVAIFGSYKENKYLDAKYVAFLNNIRDPMKRRAWLGGDWSITSGGAIDDLWNPSKHVVKRFTIPKAWKITRSFDWGSTHPFSVGFWAIANGEEVRFANGKSFCPAKNSLIRIAEIYGGEKTRGENGSMVVAYETNKGTRLSAREVARQIKEKCGELLEEGWIETPVQKGVADGQIFNVNETESDSIAQLMAKEGVEWYPADKSKGTRKNGLEMIRVALENTIQGEGAGIYIMDNCHAFLNTVPGLPRDEDDPDDVDTNSTDHVYDEVRYMVLDDKPSFAGSDMVQIKIAM